jgi:hypothetical protein
VERQGEGVDVQIQVQNQPSQVLRTEESLQPQHRVEDTKKLTGVWRRRCRVNSCISLKIVMLRRKLKSRPSRR